MRERGGGAVGGNGDTTATHDNFGAYRVLCESRLRRLERYKKSRSFCDLHLAGASESGGGDVWRDSGGGSDGGCSGVGGGVVKLDGRSLGTCSASSSSSERDTPTSADLSDCSKPTPYNLLREKMIGIMENDVALLQKLLVLGSAIQELRDRKPSSRASSSSDDEDNDDDDDESLLVEPQMSQTDDAITNLVIVADDDKLDCVESKPPSYFSRTRSVLRIPIKRASNRKLGRRVTRRPNNGLQQLDESPLLVESSSSSSYPRSRLSASRDSSEWPTPYRDGYHS